MRAMVLAGGLYRRQAGSYKSTSFVARMKSGRNMLATPGFHPGYTLPTLRARRHGAGGYQPVGARLRAMVLAGGPYRRQAGSCRSTSFVARMKSGRNMLATPRISSGLHTTHATSSMRWRGWMPTRRSPLAGDGVGRWALSPASRLLQEHQLRSPDEIREKYARHPRISSGLHT